MSLFGQSNNQDDVCIFSLKGSLDVSVQKALKDGLDKLLDPALPDLVVDLSAVTFIDSACLGTLAAFLKTVRKAGGDFKLASLCADVRSIFQITRLDTVFELHDTVHEAVASFFK